jgi:hypothetical protein
VLQREGARAYDPQLKRFLDLDRDAEDVLVSYESGLALTDDVRAVVAGLDDEAPLAWWRRLLPGHRRH